MKSSKKRKLSRRGSARARGGHSAARFSATFFAASFVMLTDVFGAVAQPAAGQLNAAEKWVAERITAGEVANLTEQFPDEQNRKLSAHFLEGLLTGTLTAVKPNRNGVRIMGAIVDEPIKLRNAQVPFEVWLDSCQFMSAVTFDQVSFGGVLSLR